MAIEDYRGDLEMCCRCSACKFVPMQRVQGFEYANVCPSVAKYNFHSYSGGGRLNIAASMLKNGFKYSDRLIDIVYNCQMDGACGVSCNYAMDMEVLEPIQEFRIKTVEDGHTLPALDKIVGNLRTQGAMVPGAAARRGDWANGLGIKDATQEKVDVLYHAGCLTSFNEDMRGLARSTARLLRKAGVNFGIGGAREVCCGGRAYQMGYKQDFLNQANKSMELVRKCGARTLVTGCAHCYQAFKVLYDKFDLKGDLEVLHTTEYFARLTKEGRLKPSKEVKLAVTYHDPCRLGRLGEPWVHWKGTKVPGHRFVFDPPKTYRRGTNGVYGPPRDLLKSIPAVSLTEMGRTKEYAWCCGAGGGVGESNPGFASWTAQERVKEAESTGAEAIVTACPWCEKTLSEAVKGSDSSLKIYDVVELLEKAI